MLNNSGAKNQKPHLHSLLNFQVRAILGSDVYNFIMPQQLNTTDRPNDEYQELTHNTAAAHQQQKQQQTSEAIAAIESVVSNLNEEHDDDYEEDEMIAVDDYNKFIAQGKINVTNSNNKSNDETKKKILKKSLRRLLKI